MAARKQQGLEVWKFGGASLADGQAIARAATRIAAHDGPLVVVASALGGVTDLLLDGAQHAVEGRDDEATRIARTVRRPPPCRGQDGARPRQGAARRAGGGRCVR